jgi:hypothetical protein
MRVRAVALSLAVVFAVASVGTLRAQDSSPVVERYKAPAVGTTWVFETRRTGSFGTDTTEATWTYAGKEKWNGREVHAFREASNTVYRDDEGRGLGRLANGKLVESFEPFHESFSWPLKVGKRWTFRFNYRDHERGHSSDVLQFARVEAYEDVTTPAGTFKTLRIKYEDTAFFSNNSWSPDIGLTVKVLEERNASHFRGGGTRTVELKSYTPKQ